MHAAQGEGTFGKFSLTRYWEHVKVEVNKTQAKPTHQNIIRLAPPLVITEAQIDDALKIIQEAVEELPTLSGEKEAKILPTGEKNVHIGVDN